MYHPVEPEQFQMRPNSELIQAKVTLKDQHGGISHIYEDDHCYVLCNKAGETDGVPIFNKVFHWYPEAVEALKALPTPKICKFIIQPKAELKHPQPKIHEPLQRMIVANELIFGAAT